MAGTLFILFVVSLVAAFFDAIAGGGGLITLPALILAGLDPVAAVATNKLQSSCGSVAATIVFARHGYLTRRLAWIVAAFAFGASVLGAIAVSHVPRDVLTIAMPFALLGVAAYFTWARPSEEDAAARMPVSIFAIAYAPPDRLLRRYFRTWRGLVLHDRVRRPAGLWADAGDGSRQIAERGQQSWRPGTLRDLWTNRLADRAGDGGRVPSSARRSGARLGLRNGARLIRPLVVAVCMALAIKLLLDAYRRGLFVGG